MEAGQRTAPRREENMRPRSTLGLLGMFRGMVGASVLLTSGIPMPAGASRPTRVPRVKVRYVRNISGPSPFAPDGCGLGTTDQGSEYEPDIAINPAKPRTLIAVWSQDNQISNVVGASRDGGKHWKEVLVPGLSKCTGGTGFGAFDARVAIGSDGTAYVSSPTTGLDTSGLFWTLRVNRSTDGGRSWSDPMTIDRAGPFPDAALDFPVLTADPAIAGAAYLLWSRISQRTTSQEFFSRTTDSGATWSPPTMIPIDPQPTQTPFASQMRVLPDGTLVNVFIQFPISVDPIGPTGVWTVRSTDHGGSWSAPIHVVDIPENVVTDPDSGKGLGRGASFVVPSIAVGPDGVVYVVWHLIESATSSQVLLVKSVDGGLTWSTPAPVVAEASQAFKSTVAVSPSGTLGVTYFDFRNDVSGDQGLTTDLWFRQSQDGGATWSETHVDGPFDLHPAPSPGGFPLGDYFGLAPIGKHDFGATFVRTITPQTAGVTDVFFARIHVPRTRAK
jgi:BNR repeat protein